MTPKPWPRRRCLSALLLPLLPAPVLRAQAQSVWPARAVSIVVPYAAGGASDFGARLIATEMARLLGQAVVVDNVAGAGGALGVQKVARSAADGYTLLYGSLSELALVPLINPRVNYRLEDLVPVAFTGNTPIAVLARPDLPVHTLDELFALARRQPERISYGSPGIGTFQHLMTEAMAARAQVRLVHVPYKGGGQIMTDLAGGQIDLGITSLPNVIAMSASGKVKVLGVSTHARSSALRDVPAFGETSTLKGLEFGTWGMLMAPAGTPAAVLARLHAVTNQALQLPAVREARLKAGSELSAPMSLEQAQAFVLAEREKFRPIAATVKPE